MTGEDKSDCKSNFIAPICHFHRPVSWPRHRCGERAVSEWRNDLKSFLERGGNMADFLTQFASLSINDAGLLMSLVGQLKVCQVVDPQKTARFEFPKWVLKEYGFQMLH